MASASIRSVGRSTTERVRTGWATRGAASKRGTPRAACDRDDAMPVTLSRRQMHTSTLTALVVATAAPRVAYGLVEESRAEAVFETVADSIVALAEFRTDGSREFRGSGVVWAKSNVIVTNFHVAAQLVGGKADIRASLPNSSSTSAAADWFTLRLIASDRERDVAVVELVGLPPGIRPPPIAVGTSGDLKVGQSCYVVGADAFGGRTLSVGIVSGLNRSVPSKQGSVIRNVIQTDAAVSEDSAGGALLDSNGRMIGLVVTLYGSAGSVGVNSSAGFALAVDSLVLGVPKMVTR